MNIPFYDCMTNSMKEAVDLTLNEDKLKEEFLFCHSMYIKCKNAGSIKLPHKTEDGVPVLYGAKKSMHELQNYWEMRKDLVRTYLPREWVYEQENQ